MPQLWKHMEKMKLKINLVTGIWATGKESLSRGAESAVPKVLITKNK